MELNKGYIAWLLMTNDIAVERAIVAIYNRQTEMEKEAKETIKCNGVGFTASDAKFGSYMAKWILSGKKLSGVYLEKGRKMSIKYCDQLLQIALEKQNKEKMYIENERKAIQEK